MDQILEWLSQYSAPVVLLLAFGAAVAFALQQVAERVIAAQFARQQKQLDLLMTRRSNFEERVLLDQYEMVTTLQLRLAGIGADVNRMRRGDPVEGLMKGREIVPLTEIFTDLQARRFMLRESLYRLLQKQAQVLLDAANTSSGEDANRLGKQYLALGDELREEMNRIFGIDAIGWSSLNLHDQ